MFLRAACFALAVLLVYAWVIGDKFGGTANEKLALRRISEIHRTQEKSRARSGSYADVAYDQFVVPGYCLTFDQTPAGYEIRAWPAQFGVTGRRNFYSDQSGVIRQNWSAEPATAASPEVR